MQDTISGLGKHLLEKFLPKEPPRLVDDVIRQVMRYLRLSDRKNARLVCKNWYEISFAPEIIKRDFTSVKKLEDLDIFHPLYWDVENSENKLLSHHRNVRVVIRNSTAKSAFWTDHGPGIKFLSLGVCNICVDNPILFHIFEQCPNVECVEISRHDGPVCTQNFEKEIHDVSLPKLSHLLLNISCLNGICIEKIMEKAGELVSLTLQSIKSTDLEWEYVYDAPFEKILTFLKKDSCRVENLFLRNSGIRDDGFKELISAIGPRLSRLEMSYLPNLYLYNTRNHDLIFTKLCNLKQFRLNQFSYNTDFFNRILTSSPELTKISLNRIKYIDELNFQSFQLLNNLTEIDLSFNFITEKVFLTGFGETVLPKITHMTLDLVRGLSSNVLKIICPNLPNLKHLSLAHCDFVNDDGVKAICRWCTELKSLNLNFCSNIHSLGTVSPCINDLLNLVELNVSQCKGLDGQPLNTLRVARMRLTHVMSNATSRKRRQRNFFDWPLIYFLFREFKEMLIIVLFYVMCKLL